MNIKWILEFKMWLGTIPTFLCLLTALKELGLESTSMSGIIPNCICNLIGLTQLSIAGNSLIKGSIPSQIGLLTGLTSFDAHGCLLSGMLLI